MVLENNKRYLHGLYTSFGGIVADGCDQFVFHGARRSEDLQVEVGWAPGVVLECDHLGGGHEVFVGVRDVHGVTPRV